MSKISKKRRKFGIKRKRKLKKNLMKLKKMYFTAKTDQEKQKIIEKFTKIAPHLNPKKYFEK